VKCDRKNNLLSEINLSKFREYPQIARHVCKSQHESKVPGSIRPCCMLHRRYVPGPYAVTCDDRIGAYRRSANGDGATPPLPLSLRPFPASLFRPRQFPYSFPPENPPFLPGSSATPAPVAARQPGRPVVSVTRLSCRRRRRGSRSPSRWRAWHPPQERMRTRSS